MGIVELITEKLAQHSWNNMSDEQILEAYNDSTEWIYALENITGDTAKKITTSCNQRLEKRIIPQMKKRGLI